MQYLRGPLNLNRKSCLLLQPEEDFSWYYVPPCPLRCQSVQYAVEEFSWSWSLPPPSFPLLGLSTGQHAATFPLLPSSRMKMRNLPLKKSHFCFLLHEGCWRNNFLLFALYSRHLAPCWYQTAANEKRFEKLILCMTLYVCWNKRFIIANLIILFNLYFSIQNLSDFKDYNVYWLETKGSQQACLEWIKNERKKFNNICIYIYFIYFEVFPCPEKECLEEVGRRASFSPLFLPFLPQTPSRPFPLFWSSWHSGVLEIPSFGKMIPGA